MDKYFYLKSLSILFAIIISQNQIRGKSVDEKCGASCVRNIKNLLSPNDPDQSLKNVLRRLSKSNVDDYDNGYIRGAARRAQTNHLNEEAINEEVGSPDQVEEEIQDDEDSNKINGLDSDGLALRFQQLGNVTARVKTGGTPETVNITFSIRVEDKDIPSVLKLVANKNSTEADELRALYHKVQELKKSSQSKQLESLSGLNDKENSKIERAQLPSSLIVDKPLLPSLEPIKLTNGIPIPENPNDTGLQEDEDESSKKATGHKQSHKKQTNNKTNNLCRIFEDISDLVSLLKGLRKAEII